MRFQIFQCVWTRIAEHTRTGQYTAVLVHATSEITEKIFGQFSKSGADGE